MKKLIEKIKAAIAAKSDTLPEDLPAATGDANPPVLFGMRALLAGFAILILWAAFAPLDEGVPAMGTVMVDTKRKPVQHLTGGIVEKVLVKEAQMVEQNEPLVKLDDGVASANHMSAKLRYLGLRAMQNRLQAERSGVDKILFADDVLAASEDPVIRQQIQTEEHLFISRRASLKSEMGALDEAIQAQTQAAVGYMEQMKARKQQTGYLTEERNGLRDLVQEGYAPRNKLLELERMLADNSAMIASLQGEYVKAKKGGSELVLKKVQRQQEYFKEVESQLAEIQRSIAADQEKFLTTRDDLERTVIRSPAKGAVVGLMAQSPGTVIPAGGKIMDIVPENEQLLLEARIPPHLIDRIHPGQLTDVRFSGFAHTPQLVVEGKLLSSSADLLLDQATNTQYYLARVEVTKNGLKTLGKRVMQPGMPVEIVIKTGERSLLSYLFSPLVKRIAQSMNEE